MERSIEASGRLFDVHSKQARARRGLAAAAVVAIMVGAVGAGHAAATVQTRPALGQAAEATPNTSKCLTGNECRAVSVTGCPQVSESRTATLDIWNLSSPKGVLVFFSGGGGTKLWSREKLLPDGSVDEDAAAKALAFLQDLRANGYITIQVAWHNAWLAAPNDDPVGPARLACRSATVVKYLYDTFWAPLGQFGNGLECGFCLTGNSGGSTQIAYSLSFYGLFDLVDAAVLTGGPPHAGLDRACLNEPGYEYTQGLNSVLDVSYGYQRPQLGPCENHDTTWTWQWRRDGVDTGGSFYNLPDRIRLVVGSEDETKVNSHQLLYASKLEAAGSPFVEQITVPGMTHAITASDDGLELIKEWFLAS